MPGTRARQGDRSAAIAVELDRRWPLVASMPAGLELQGGGRDEAWGHG
ncbi:MAG TPA: hypothetical protein VMY43_04570 [Methanothrix sp.]|nr:hypothetical protein [Methanothrix sp.]